MPCNSSRIPECVRRSRMAVASSTAGLAPLLLLLLTAAPASLPAQARGTSYDIEHYRVELAGVSDTLQLRRSEYALGGSGGTREAEARRLLRRGLVRLRLGEMGDGWSFGRAAGDFSDAADAEPDWAYAWYARGMALRGQYDWHAANRMNLGKRVGFGSLEDAVDAFAESLLRDPTYLPAIEALFDAAVTLRDTARIATIVLPALRTAAAAGVTDPAAFLALNRAERVMGDAGNAVEAARAFLARGGNQGLGLRELAGSALVINDPVGDSAYFAGALFDDSATVAAYREDLALIADDSVLATFDRSNGSGRVDFLRQYWSDKDREALRSPGERLREHYRRINHAERHYKLEVNRRYYNTGTDMYRVGGTRFDDRGVVYVRYGEPRDKIITVTYGIQPNETWTYPRADGDFLLHFAANAGGDIHDHRLIRSIMDIGGVTGSADTPATFFAFKDRCEVYAPYCKFLNWGRYGQEKILRAERIIVANSVSWAVTTDGDDLRFNRPLQAITKAFAVGRAADDRQLIHVAYQVALDRPDSLPEQVAFRVPLRVRVNLSDSLGHSRGWVDTTTSILLPGGGVTARQVDAVGRVTLTAPAGRWRYQVALSYDDSTGRVIRSDTVAVGRFDGTRLAVSDLVLSKDGKGAPWAPAPGDTAWFNPRTTWSRSDVLAVYHEVYGLEPGTEYREDLVLRRGKKAELTLGWSGVAREETLRVARMLALEKVKPGNYIMEFVVRLPDGRKAMTRQAIKVE